MDLLSENLLLTLVLAPLFGSIVAGLFGKKIGEKAAHTVTIIGVAIAFVLSAWVFKLVIFDGASYVRRVKRTRAYLYSECVLSIKKKKCDICQKFMSNLLYLLLFTLFLGSCSSLKRQKHELSM